MIKYIMASLLAITAFATPAEAHKRYRTYRNNRVTIFVCPWVTHWRRPAPRIRLNKNCVWKPWNNRTICKY